jgi:D-glycero-D-manno-heptose 1,7-bisphosphate phosphatase
VKHERYVVLDRDGVINYESEQFIKSPEEWRPLPGSLEAIALLNKNGFKVAVASNQSGVARGLFDQAMLAKIHDKMQIMAARHGGRIEAIYYCPHGPQDHCLCRKPKPGLLHSFAKDYEVDLRTVTVIGDSLRDIQAAQNVGALPILVKTGNGKKTANSPLVTTIPVFENLYAAAQFLIDDS